jgi:hypothetical protein
MRALYLTERVTTQLIEESDIVSVASTTFILFPFSLADQDLVTWKAGIPFENRVDVETSLRITRVPSCFLLGCLFR